MPERNATPRRIRWVIVGPLALLLATAAVVLVFFLRPDPIADAGRRGADCVGGAAGRPAVYR